MAAAGLVAVAAAAPAGAAETGAFPLCYHAKSKPGAVFMGLDMIVVTPGKTMSGKATMTQAVNPPLDVKLDVKGGYTDESNGHMAKLTSPDMPGRHVTIVLNAAEDWKTATADYTLWLDTPDGTKTGKLDLVQIHCQ
jgi:hypothetical protein